MAGATMSWRQRFMANDGNSWALLAARTPSVASGYLSPSSWGMRGPAVDGRADLLKVCKVVEQCTSADLRHDSSTCWFAMHGLRTSRVLKCGQVRSQDRDRLHAACCTHNKRWHSLQQCAIAGRQPAYSSAVQHAVANSSYPSQLCAAATASCSGVRCTCCADAPTDYTRRTCQLYWHCLLINTCHLPSALCCALTVFWWPSRGPPRYRVFCTASICSPMSAAVGASMVLSTMPGGRCCLPAPTARNFCSMLDGCSIDRNATASCVSISDRCMYNYTSASTLRAVDEGHHGRRVIG